MKRLVLASLILFLGGCVSVQLPGQKISHAENIVVAAPTKPFEEIQIEQYDRAWKNPHTKNALSYSSICNDSGDPNLKAIQAQTLKELESPNVQIEKTLTYNGREGLRTVAFGKIDGVSISVSLMIFKKNGCSYTLAFVGPEEEALKEKDVFEKFLKGFKAP